MKRCPKSLDQWQGEFIVREDKEYADRMHRRSRKKNRRKKRCHMKGASWVSYFREKREDRPQRDKEEQKMVENA